MTSYFDINSDATSYTVDTVSPIPPSSEWGSMSIPQLLELKSRLLNYYTDVRNLTEAQKHTILQGVSRIDAITAPSPRE